MKKWPKWLKAYAKQEGWVKDHIKEIRQNLMAKDPHCHWCGVEVVYFPLEDSGQTPKNFATIDHLYDKFDPVRRYKVYKNLENIVLACHSCNARRARESHSQKDRAWLVNRSKLATQRPKGMPKILFFGDMPIEPIENS